MWLQILSCSTTSWHPFYTVITLVLSHRRLKNELLIYQYPHWQNPNDGEYNNAIWTRTQQLIPTAWLIKYLLYRSSEDSKTRWRSYISYQTLPLSIYTELSNKPMQPSFFYISNSNTNFVNFSTHENQNISTLLFLVDLSSPGSLSTNAET